MNQLFLFLLIIFGVSFCASNNTGVCTGDSKSSSTIYCKNGWTKSECDDWNSQKINGTSWNFYEGQTCEGRGTPATP